MKQKWLLLISLIMVLGLSTAVSAGPTETFLDFEGFTGTGTPPGMSASNITEIKAATVDEEHGVSVKVTAPGMPIYGFDNSVSSGRLMLGFDVLRADFDMDFRIHVRSEKSNTDAHSLFFMPKAGTICGANTAAGAWSFPELVKDISLNQWYNINILVDFDKDNVYYYVDGKLLGSSKLAFEDMKILYFRMEAKRADTVPYVYLDNLEIKYVKSENISLVSGNKPVKAGSDTVELAFGDFADKNSLGNIRAYCMGTNPVELQKEEVECFVESVSGKKAVIRFSENLAENSTYKVEIPGAKSIFGEEFSNDVIYFSTTRELAIGYAVNADFSKAVNSSSKITVPNDGDWEKSATSIYLAKDADLGESVVGFKRNNNDLIITREFGTVYENDLDIAFKVKSAKENIAFRCYDSEGNQLDVLDLKADGFYFGDTKLSDVTLDEWNDIKIQLNSENKTLVFDINGVVSDEVSYDGLNDIVKIDFCQYNSEGAAGADRAMNYMADFSIKTMMPQISAQKVYFEDEAGEIFYPEGDIPSNASKIMIEFSDAVSGDTLNDGVKLLINGEEEEYFGEYNEDTRVFTMNLPQYLAGNATYSLEITEDALDSVGAPVTTVGGNFTTEEGFYKGNNLDISVLGNEVIVNTEIIHTDESYKDAYLVYAAYKNNLMVDFDYIKVTPEESQRKITVESDGYILPEGTNKVSVFLWEGFGKDYGMMNPVLVSKTVEME